MSAGFAAINTKGENMTHSELLELARRVRFAAPLTAYERPRLWGRRRELLEIEPAELRELAFGFEDIYAKWRDANTALARSMARTPKPAPPLKCGHPAICLDADEDGDEFCEWCREVGDARDEANALREALHGLAVVVNGGKVEVRAPVGYLAMFGGNVLLGEKPTTTYVRPDGKAETVTE